MEARSMLLILLGNTIKFLQDAVLAVLVAVVGRDLPRLVQIRAKKPRPHRYAIDFAVLSVTVVLTLGGTSQERKAMKDAKSEGCDGRLTNDRPSPTA
jgi:hypothetical protein